MNWKISLSVSAVLLIIAGCVSIDYKGKTYPPTTKVDVFWSKEAIKRPYSVMGKAVVSTWYMYQRRDAKPAIIAKAKECGADAVYVHAITETTRRATRQHADDINATSISDPSPGVGVRNVDWIYNEQGEKVESVDRSKAVIEFLKYTDGNSSAADKKQ
jgi:hypothetical protein